MNVHIYKYFISAFFLVALFTGSSACEHKVGVNKGDSVIVCISNALVDTLGDKILVLKDIEFAQGSASLDSASLARLDEIVEVLKVKDGVYLTVIGYPDTEGASYFTFILAKQRAIAITDYLISKGVDGDRVRAEANGEDKNVENKDDILPDLLGRVELVFR